MSIDNLKIYLNTVIPENVIIASVVVLCIVILCSLIFLKDSRKRWKAGIAAMLAEFVFLVVSDTVFFREEGENYICRLTPFASYFSNINGGEVIESWEIVLNVLLFVPFGLLGGCLVKRWYVVVLAALCLSSTIECLQYLMHRGFCETDDVIHNTLGAVVGVAAAKLCRRQGALQVKSE